MRLTFPTKKSPGPHCPAPELPFPSYLPGPFCRFSLLVLIRRVFFLLIGCLLTAGLPAAAQKPPAAPPAARYWVQLRDKAGVTFAPAAYFAPAAQARRRRQHLPPADSTDFPVRPDYLRRVRAAVDTVTLVSRWFNAVVCRATPAQAAALLRLPGVRAVRLLPDVRLLPAARAAATPAPAGFDISATDRQLARRQTSSLGGADFRRAGLDGRGLRIAIFDVGFNGVEQHPAFVRLRENHQLIATHDFLKNQESVYHGGSHGGEVLSCLAGRLPDGTCLGLAPGAVFLLARTEQMFRERYAEEEAWLAAAEWADRNGADIINSSLGYTTGRYFPEQMNGRTSLVARAAEMAVRKGILVVNAAGNDGDDDEWRTVGTPADGDSVLAVGGLDPDTYLHSDFSSYGPAAGRRLKPNVAAFGTVLAAGPGGYERIEGTSFASPLLAGFAACAWQHERSLSVMQLFARLQMAGDLYPYYDYAHGYGRPRAAAVLRPGAAPAPAPTFDFVPNDSAVAVVIRRAAAVVPAHTLPLYADSARAAAPADDRAVPAVGRETALPAPDPADDLPPDSAPPAYLYWHVADARGVLRSYEVLAVRQRAVLTVPRRQLQPGDTLRVHYRGFTQSYAKP